MTKAIENKLAKRPLYSQEGKGKDAEIVCKFFNPYGMGTWYVIEGEKQPNGDWLFFGLVDLHEKEYGYFMLSELESVRFRFGGMVIGGIERDMYFGTKKVREVA